MLGAWTIASLISASWALRGSRIVATRSLAVCRVAAKAADAAELSEIIPGKAIFLVGRWRQAVENDVALGCLPPHTHPHRDVPRLVRLNAVFTDMYSTTMTIAAASRGGDEARKALGAPLSTARVVGTIRALSGAALAVVSERDDDDDDDDDGEFCKKLKTDEREREIAEY